MKTDIQIVNQTNKFSVLKEYIICFFNSLYLLILDIFTHSTGVSHTPPTSTGVSHSPHFRALIYKKYFTPTTILYFHSKKVDSSICATNRIVLYTGKIYVPFNVQFLNDII
jgi:hypothetical protein